MVSLHARFLHSTNVSYFSYFSEISDRSPSHVARTVVETLAISAVMLVSVAANVGAALLVVRERRGLVANRTLLVLNLFAADLLFVSMAPLIAAVRWTMSWRLGYAVCHVMQYVLCVSASVTISTLASISAERVWAVLRLRTGPALDVRAVSAVLAFVWGFSALASVPISLFFNVMEEEFPHQEHFYICTIKWPDVTAMVVWNVSFTTLCFLLPGLIIVVSYSRILQITKCSRRRLWSRVPPSSRGRHLVSRQDMKLFRTLAVLVLSFLLLWSPIFVVDLLLLARNIHGGRLHVSSSLFFWVLTFTLTNSALNPILYAVFQFKNGWRRLCSGSAVAPAVLKAEHQVVFCVK